MMKIPQLAPLDQVKMEDLDPILPLVQRTVDPFQDVPARPPAPP
jgi:hypothetical protein